MLRRILLINCVFFLLSACNAVVEPPFDHPAYHNPTVQPLTEAIAQDPKDPELYFQRSIALSHINQDSLSLADLERAVQLDSLNPQYIQAIGFVQLNLDNPHAAVQAFRKSLNLAPEDQRLRLLLAKAYIAAGDLDHALEYTNEVIKSAPGYAEAELIFAQIKAAQKDTATAIQMVRSLLSRDSRHYEASLQLADWYKAQRNPMAVGQYEQTFAMDTTDATPLYEIGRFYEESRNLAKAKEAFRRCIVSDPDYTYAYIHYGDILMKEDSFVKAKKQYELAIRREPANADAWYGKGRTFEKLQLKDSALHYYRQSLVFDPSLEEAREAAQILKAKNK